MSDKPRCWAFGGGVDSSAGIIADVQDGKRIDLVTMGDVGSESDDTYQWVKRFDTWLRGEIGIGVTMCKYTPQAKTQRRYQKAVDEVIELLGVNVSAERRQRLSGIYGNMVANRTLPSIAYNMKSCSVKWKLAAQEPI